METLKLERSPSHSWWWNSHNSPKHSKWLQSNLKELDEKVQEMLQLIEEDADSFAQRAEMYYKKRPELVSLVEEFYRAYRSLAERYDRLTGEIRQNIPRALQLQYGLSCDSANKSMGSAGLRHTFSPLRKNHQAFENLLKKAGGQPVDGSEDSDADHMQTPSTSNAREDSEGGVHVADSAPNCHDDPSVEFPNKESILSPEKVVTSSSSDSDIDNNANSIDRLEQEIIFLEQENKMLASSHSKVVELNIALQKRVESLEGRWKTRQNEAHAIESRVNNNSVSVPVEETASMKASGLSGLLLSKSRNEGYAEQVIFEEGGILASACQDRLERDAANALAVERAGSSHQFSASACGGGTGPCSAGLQDQIMQLMQENQRYQLALLERGEEKREAIRQLCFSIDILQLENRRLEVMLCSLNRKYNDLVATHHQQFLPWGRVLCLGD